MPHLSRSGSGCPLGLSAAAIRRFRLCATSVSSSSAAPSRHTTAAAMLASPAAMLAAAPAATHARLRGRSAPSLSFGGFSGAVMRAVWPTTRITVRADSGFCRDALLTWCEAEPGVEYVMGLPRNQRLAEHVDVHRDELTKEVEETQKPARRYEDFRYRTRKSWSAERRVVGKAEALPGKWNPRFVVTSLPAEEWSAERLYKELYCARGDMENRIKEQQLGMFADRASNRSLRGNQLRLTFSGLAYTTLVLLRRLGLQSTSMARAQVWTLRNKLVKIGALVTQSVRRVRVSMSSSFPHQALYRLAQRRVSRVEVRG